MSKHELSRLVASYIAKGGAVKVLPAGDAKGVDYINAWAAERKAA